MYRSLFKWSSGVSFSFFLYTVELNLGMHFELLVLYFQYVPELFSLEKRLLCVETYETNVNLIKSVMKEVAAIASFVSFVPLANRVQHYQLYSLKYKGFQILKFNNDFNINPSLILFIKDICYYWKWGKNV